MSKHPVTVSVTKRKGESDERLIRRFLKKWKKENVMFELMERRYHQKPSVKRRKKKERAARRRYVEKRRRERQQDY